MDVHLTLLQLLVFGVMSGMLVEGVSWILGNRDNDMSKIRRHVAFETPARIGLSSAVIVLAFILFVVIAVRP